MRPIALAELHVCDDGIVAFLIQDAVTIEAHGDMLYDLLADHCEDGSEIGLLWHATTFVAAKWPKVGAMRRMIPIPVVRAFARLIRPAEVETAELLPRWPAPAGQAIAPLVMPFDIWPNRLPTKYIEDHCSVLFESVLRNVVRRWLPISLTQQPPGGEEQWLIW